MSRTPLVHVDQPVAGADVGDLVGLTRDEVHHLRSVLRLRVGNAVEVSDGGGGHATGELLEEAVRLRTPGEATPPPRPPLRVVQALPKGRKLDEVVRVCVELGMDTLVPVAAERSVRRPEGERAVRAVARWEAVARSACEQARRTHRPHIAPITSVGGLVPDGRWLLAHPTATESLPHVLVDVLADGLANDAAEDPDAAGTPGTGGRDGAVTIVVGTEGGWSEAEVDDLVAAGARGVHLGPTVLRTEHAAAAALAVTGAALGRWARTSPGSTSPHGR